MTEVVETAIYRLAYHAEGKPEVDQLNASVRENVAAAEAQSTTQERVTKATRTSADAMERLLSRLDPRIRAEQQLRNALEQVERLEEEGIGTATQRAQAIDAANRRYEASIGRLQQAPVTIQAIGQASQLGAFQLQNLQFQMQDLGQAIATGQPLFRTFIQQGSQIAQVFGPGTGVGGALKQVAQGLLQYVLNPLNLIVLAIAAVAGAAEYFFSRIGVGADDTEAVLERHRKLIDDIGDAYGEAGEKATRYAETSRQVLLFEAQQVAAQQRRILEGLLSDFRNQMSLPSTADAALQGLGFGQLAEGLRTNIPVIDEFVAAIARGQADIIAFRDHLATLGAALPADNPTRRYIEEILKVTNDAAAAAIRLREAQGAVAISTPVGTPSDMSLREFGLRFNPRPIPKDDSAEREAAREKERIDSLVRQLRFQEMQLGRTTAAQAEYDALQRAGIDATHARAEEVRAAARALYEHEEALKKAEEAQKRFADSMAEIGDVVANVLDRWIVQGDKFSDILNDLLKQLASQALRSAINGLFGGGGAGGQGAGVLGDLLAGFLGRGRGGAPLDLLGFRRSPAAVGASLPSVMAPTFAAAAAAAPVASAIRGPVLVHVTLSGARGDREIMSMVERGVRAGVEDFNAKVLPARVAEIASDPTAR